MGEWDSMMGQIVDGNQLHAESNFLFSAKFPEIKQMNVWIKCSDRLPEETQFIGLCSDGLISCFKKDNDYCMTGGWGICGYCGGTSLAVLDGVKDDSRNIKKITHWMPLPTPPEE